MMVYQRSCIRLSFALLVCLALIPLPAAAQEAERTFPVSRLIDRTVKDFAGNDLGEIEDLVVRRHGRVKEAIIAHGGFLGIGERHVAVPFRSLEIGAKGVVRCDTTAEALSKAAEFDYMREGVFTGQHYTHLPYHYPHYGPMHPRMQPEGAPRHMERPMPPGGSVPYGTPVGPGSYYMPHGRPYGPRMGGEDPERRYHPWTWALFPRSFLATAAMGRRVVNKDGEDPAVVEDLLVSGEGRVRELVLSVGGALANDKLIAVRYEPLGFINWAVTYQITAREADKLPAYHYPQE
jgi:sporulation protein YlmC with PRC-barrel domain